MSLGQWLKSLTTIDHIILIILYGCCIYLSKVTLETLIEMYPKVFEMCAEKGYNMTGRDHIIAFDTERGV